MGCVLCPPVSIIYPLHRLHRLHRRRPTRKTQQPVLNLAPPCIPTPRASNWRWRAVLNEFSRNVKATPTSLPTEQVPPAARATITTTTAATTNEKWNHDHKSCNRKKSRLITKWKDGEMEQQVIALPSIVLSISILALGATVGSRNCASPSASGVLSVILSKFVDLGLGLNLSTLAPLLTLAWHALSLLPCRPTSRTYYRSLSLSATSPTVAEANGTLSTAIQTRVRRVWAPHALALLWVLNILLVLAVPRWTSSTAFAYAGVAVLSGLEAGTLALGGVLAQCQIQRELAGEMDDECGWEHGDVDHDSDGDDDDAMKVGPISPA